MINAMDAKNIIITGLDLTDSKKVLLLAPDDFGQQEMHALQTELNKRFPLSEFLLLNGGFQVAGYSTGPVEIIEGDDE